MTPTRSITTLPDRARLRIAATALAIVLAEVVVAATVVEPRLTRVLLLGVAAAGLAFAFVLPFATACIFLGLSASVLYDSYFSFRAGVQVTAPQVVLAALLLVAVVRPRRASWGGFAGAALLAFLCVLVLATFTAVSAGRVDLHTGVNSVRPFFLLTFFWVVVRLFPEPERARKLLVAAAVLAAGTGVVELATSVAGSVASPLQDPGHGLISDAGLGGLLRVRLPGVALAYGLFWWIGAQAIGGERRKPLWMALWAASVVCILISFNRNMWLGVILGLALVLVVAGAQTRGRLLGALAAATAGIALVVIVGPQLVGPTSALEPLVKRGSTLLSPGRELSQDSSLRSRSHETLVAWRAVRGNLGLGLGPGAEFGVFFDANLGGGRYQRAPQTFLHNQYLFLIVSAGVGALAAFLAYLLAILATAWRARRRDALYGTLLTGVVMTMISATVMISFADPAFLVLLGLVGGVVRVGATSGPPA